MLVKNQHISILFAALFIEMAARLIRNHDAA